MAKAPLYCWMDYEIQPVPQGVRIELGEKAKPSFMVMAASTADAMTALSHGLLSVFRLRIVDRAPRTFLRGRFLMERLEVPRGV